MTDESKKDDSSQKKPLIKQDTITPRPTDITFAGTAPAITITAYSTTANSSLSTASTTLSALAAGRLDPSIFPRLTAYDDETESLRRSVAEALNKAQKSEEQNRQLSQTIRQLQTRLDFVYFWNHVTPEAYSHLLDSEPLRSRLVNETEFPAYVISIDLRRSTELMLKARSSNHFAEFLRSLCTDLMTTITDQYGVVDKFTGDGVLGYFPEFLAGSDAGFRALTAAEKCHELFKQCYEASRNCFKAILADVGLGIGVDYGAIQLVKMPDALTIVGEPVVFACRLSDGPAGGTYINQIAFEKLMEKYASCYLPEEIRIPFKHDGDMFAHMLKRNTLPFKPAAPD